MHWLTFLCLLISVLAFGLPDPYVIEAKVQQDLENSLSRLIPREQFILQVSAEVKVETERRFVEGENVANAIPVDPEDIPPPPMPGFIPEPTTKAPLLPHQTRQVFKTIEVPTLKSIRVHTSFDDQLPLATVTKGRLLVTTYMNSNYAGKASTTFGQMPMIKVDKKKEIKEEQDDLLKKLTDWDKRREKPPPTLEEQAWKYGRWTALLLLLVIMFVQFLKPQLAKMQHLYQNAGSGNANEREPTGSTRYRSEADLYANAPEARGVRKQLLDRFLIRSEVFKEYYEKLSKEEKSDLYGAFGGPGYDRLLEGLRFKIPTNPHEPANIEEFLDEHAKKFDEMVRAADWQDRQFFGFLQQMKTDQVLTLAQHVSPRGLAMMLRFMKPQQSAKVIDALPPVRRIEVLSAMDQVMKAPLTECHQLEHEVREIAQQLPSHAFGTEKENLGFWGNLVSESSHQDELLEAIEKTNPGIFGAVKKFKFSLEDIATLPTKTIEAVLSDVDNSVLGQALATCREDLIQVILDGVSPKRRAVIHSQIASYRRVPKDALSSARATLTRKFREALAA